jgi:hypothetical protein
MGEANKRLFQKSLQRPSSPSTVLIREFLGLPEMQSATGAWDAAAFSAPVTKDPETTKEKSYRHLAGGGWQPSKADFAHC